MPGDPDYRGTYVEVGLSRYARNGATLGYSWYPSPPKEKPTWPWVLAFGGPTIGIIIIVLWCYCCHKCRDRRADERWADEIAYQEDREIAQARMSNLRN